MADLNSTLIHGSLRVTEDTNITGNLTINGSSVAFPSAIKISGITSNGALYYNSAGTVSISAIPAAQVNADWSATTGVASILNKPTIPTVPNEYGKIQVGSTTTTAGTTQSTIEFSKTGNLTVAIDGNKITYGYTTPASLPANGGSAAYAAAATEAEYLMGSYTAGIGGTLIHPSGNRDVFWIDQYSAHLGTLGDNVTIDMDDTNSILSLTASGGIVLNGSTLGTAAFYASTAFATAGHNHSAFSVYGGATNVVTYTGNGTKSVKFEAGSGISITGSASGSAYGIITISAPLYAHYINLRYNSGDNLWFDIRYALYAEFSTALNALVAINAIPDTSDPNRDMPATGILNTCVGSVFGSSSTFCTVAGLCRFSGNFIPKVYSIYTLSGSIATFNFVSTPFMLPWFPTVSEVISDCVCTDTVVKIS